LVKKKQQEMMEEQLKSFAGSTAGSILIAVGIGVAAFPYAVKYLVKNAEEQAIPWALGLGKEFYDEYTGTIKAALKKLEADEWHEANPDVTQQDLDIPEGIQNYFIRVGLPASSHLVAFGDKETMAVFQHSGEWNYYGTRRINEQEYYLIVPKGIRVYIKVQRTLTADPVDDKCPVGFTIERLPHPSTASICKKAIRERFNVPPFATWP
jgi:hypothetical protein